MVVSMDTMAITTTITIMDITIAGAAAGAEVIRATMGMMIIRD